MLNKQVQYIKKHKIFLIIVLIVIIGISYFFYNKYQTNKKNAEISYVISKVEKGNIVSSISGTGQVSDSNQIELKPKVSGEVVYLNLKNGQVIKEGDVLAKIDSSDIQKTVRDAKANLDSAKISLDKLKKSADSISLLQAQNALDQAKEAKQNAQDNIDNTYEDAYNSISSAFLDMPDIITDLDNILHSSEISENEITVWDGQNNSDALISTIDSFLNKNKLETFQKSSEKDYSTARLKYDSSFDNYKKSTRYSSNKVIEDLLNKTLEAVKSISQAAKSENNYLSAWSDYRIQDDLEVFTSVSEYQTSLSSDISKINSHLSTLSTIQRSFEDNREALTDADRTITEKTELLKDLENGTDPLDIKAQELFVQQKQNTLNDAYEQLTDYTIKAPFDGIVAEVTTKKGDDVSSGTSIATLITGKQIAEVSLNEVDISQIEVGQKATLTFDAVEDLSITGEVVEVASIGSSSSNVVSYNVKINFDTQDERIKPGMSVSASIIINSKQDIIVVSSSAVKTKNNVKYVEIPDENVGVSDSVGIVLTKIPKQQIVETGISDDTSVEITSGLSEGDLIITKTINSSKSSSSNSSSSTKSSTNATKSILGGDDGPPMMR
ncbi:MAG: efflux RND transporter periplasmic adaptor subunit [Patescibacteria group bacterium]|nr:efflux RND transporter periplasmic adaptor subunit [Patescibacteria group bacterium]MDD4304494.1 efflux RND transporter periplasmic adaptor subunit [Patescibacteria group bacterium]MDD4694854.1 efflux RND transporter periplasmic adaptor subunit [Patescibacteria group bacterium]